MPLRSLLTMPRLFRHGSAIGADLPPDEAVVLDARPAPLRAAVSAATAGDHGPARELLATTRLGAEWERRSSWVGVLAESALHTPGWLDAWLSESPEDPDALLVKAELCIHRAWAIRTGARARHVSRDRFRAFFALLEDAVPVIGAAAELNPDDPVPWRIALTHARGSQAPREVFDAYWAEATARAPHHYGCHATALQYLCDKWYGSHEEMFAFAERAATDALPGSKLNALPLAAAVEYDVVADDTEDGPIDRSRITAAVDRALELSSFYEPGDPEAAGFRNELALMLVLGQRFEEALDVFRAIGAHARTQPWGYFGDAREEFLEFRTGVRMQIASRIPFFATPPPSVTGSATVAPAGPEVHLLAIAAAPPAKVAEAALLCGVPLRIAPAGAAASYVSLAPDASPGKRASLIGKDRLTGAADTFTTGEKWSALVLRRTGDRAGFTLLHKGKEAAAHEWDPAAPVGEHAAAAATAAVLARVYGLPDPRPLIGLLRSPDAPARRQADLVAALGLPPLPEGFGERPDVLATVADARLLERRGLLAGMRDTMADAPDRLLVASPGERPAPRPLRWWLTRSLAFVFFATAAGYAWWSPGVGTLRSVLFSLLALAFGAQLVGQYAPGVRRHRKAEK
ncbi:hypothetical protein [Streptomyces sp. FIT100]|uniref:hypothetical protein n=1 Tax=Streptomyces sp. FIT100 TaxID=2837956 RepID=UPI0021C5F262|nr:hypothetical protein [Streptomyces sp. FIT100]UUN26886.1 hypothetical protein KK483_11045 [Streptomyces sp. FIT100]